MTTKTKESIGINVNAECNVTSLDMKEKHMENYIIYLRVRNSLYS